MIEEIGEGGFAKVFKAKHLLDKSLYAIKQIKIDVRKCSIKYILEDLDKLLNEVRYLAKVKSHFVVDYNYSWIEVKLKVKILLSSTAN